MYPMWRQSTTWRWNYSFHSTAGTLNSIPYRDYNEPKITYISPRSGPKDGNNKVDVYGEVI